MGILRRAVCGMLLGAVCLAAVGAGERAALAQDEAAVAQLLETLQGDSPRAAAAAARGLGVLLDGAGEAPEAEAVVAGLIAGLESEDANVRAQCATALGRIKNAAGLEALRPLLADESPAVAQAAADAIGASLSPAEAKATLIEQAQSNEAGRAAAYQAFVPLATEDDVEFLLAGVADEDWHVQRYALAGLKLIAEEGATFDEAAYRQAAAVLGCEYLDGSQAAIDFFLAQGENETARAVLVEVVEFRGEGESSGEAEGSWRTRTNALRTLNELGWPATGEALPAAIRVLGDRTTNVQGEATALLLAVVREGHLTENEVIGQMLTVLENNDDLQVRAGVMERLREGVPEEFAARAEAAAVASLEASMTSETAWPLKADSIALLGVLEASGSASAIASCLNDSSPNVFRAASEALIALAPGCDEKSRAEVGAALAEVLANPREWRNAAAAARAAAYYPSREAVVPLAAALTDETPNVREAASEALAGMARQGDTSLVRAIQAAVYREMGRSRSCYPYGTVVLGATRSTSSLGLLSRVLESDEPADRAAAARAIAEIAAHNEIPPGPLSEMLESLAATDVPEVQAAAREALAEMGE